MTAPPGARERPAVLEPAPGPDRPAVLEPASRSDRLAGPDPVAAEAIELLVARGETVGTAESLTGGLVTAALTDVPGASAVVRGGVVTYAAGLKASLLGVPAALLERYGAVHPEVARAMASGARDLLGATVGLATTGVAGPDAADGQPVGTVHVAVRTRSGARQLALALAGSRDEIRAATVRHALALLVAALREQPP